MPGDTDSMFWGLVLKPEKRYEQVVEEPFHISKACVEPATCKGKVASVYVEANDEEFLVCNLSDKILNETLDLNFNQGDKIVFKSTGTGVVHLTGYNIQEEAGPGMMFGDSDDSSDEEETEEIPALTNGKKRKATSGDESTPAKKKSNKGEPSPLDKLGAAPKAKEEKKQAMEMAKKIADTIKKADDDDDSDSDDEDYEDVGEEEDGSGEEEEGEDDEDSDEEDEDADETMDSTTEGGVIRRGLSILDSSCGLDSTVGDSTLDTSEIDTSAMDTSALDTSAADTPAKPIKEEKKTPVKPAKVETPAKPATVETPAKEVNDKENETTNKPTGEADASPELSKSAKKKNKNKNKEANGAGDKTVTETKTPVKPLAETKTPQKPAAEAKKTPAKGEEAKKTPAKATPAKPAKVETPAAKTPKRTLKGGIQLEDLKVGTGAEAVDKKHVQMYYEGKLKTNGKVFDSTKSGKPFKFRLGAGEVIKGWDVGIAGMKVGGKRRLTIPPAMAYGKEGAPPDIPANSHLIFEVECKGVN